MNILYIGPYRQSDGWGQAAQQYIQALVTSNNNIAIRPIFMSSNTTNDIHPDILTLESEKLPYYDVVIQHVLPHLLDGKNDHYKTLGLCLFETDNLQHTPWIHHINNTDGIIVSSKKEIEIAKNSGVTVPLQQIPIPVDVLKFEKQYEYNSWNNANWKDSFVFYCIGEYVDRKNIHALVKAFHREFHPHENVELVIKTSRTGLTSKKLERYINEDLTKLKQTLGLYHDISHYKQEWIITEHISEHNLYALHQISDCFVMPSHGEACCMPLMDAIGFGKQTIITSNTGMESYTNSNISQIINSYEVPVCTKDKPLPFLYTGHETWMEIDILHMQKAMRKAYNMKGLDRMKHASFCKQWVNNFSYDNIGRIFNQL